MTRRIGFIGLGLALIMIIISLPSYSSAYGPEGKRVGAGLYLGEPTGLTVKGYLTNKLAIDGIAAWDFRDKAFTVIGDITYDFFHIPTDSHLVKIPFYVGGGAKFEFNGGPHDETVVGLRIPVGVAIQWVHHPIEIFAEIAPGINVSPSSDFDLMGGIGARFYF